MDPILLQSGEMSSEEMRFYFNSKEDRIQLYELDIRKQSLEILSFVFQISNAKWITPIININQ